MIKSLFHFLVFITLALTAFSSAYSAPVRYTAFPMGPFDAQPVTSPPQSHFFRMQQNVGMALGHTLTSDFYDPSHNGYRKSRFSDQLRETYQAMQCSDLLVPKIPSVEFRPNLIAGQSLIEFITRANTNAQLSQQALGNMAQRDYISSVGLQDYLASDQRLHPYQTVNFSSVTWVTIKEFREMFPEMQIPWQHIAEFEIHPDEAGQKPEDLIANTESKSRILLKRASLRLVSSFNSGPDDHPMLRLPWESTPGLTPRRSFGGYVQEHLFSFELSRAAQLKGLAGESRELVAFASLAALERFMTIRTFPSGRPPPLADGTVWLHSLSPVNTRLYRQGLGMTIHQEIKEPEYHAIMKVDLKTFIEKNKPWITHKDLHQLLNAIFDRDDDYTAEQVYFALLSRETYRENLRRSFSFSKKNTKDYDQDALVFRMNPDLNAPLYRMRIQDIPEDNFKRMIKVLDKMDSVDFSEKERGWGRDSFLEIGFQFFKEPDKVAGVFSGFNRHAGEGDPNFALNLIAHIKNTFVFTPYPERSYMLLAENDALIQQLRELGLAEIHYNNKKSFFAVDSSLLQRLSPQLEAYEKTHSEKLYFEYDRTKQIWDWVALPGL